jgi:hypothetical protein
MPPAAARGKLPRDRRRARHPLCGAPALGPLSTKRFIVARIPIPQPWFRTPEDYASVTSSRMNRSSLTPSKSGLRRPTSGLKNSLRIALPSKRCSSIHESSRLGAAQRTSVTIERASWLSSSRRLRNNEIMLQTHLPLRTRSSCAPESSGLKLVLRRDAASRQGRTRRTVRWEGDPSHVLLPRHSAHGANKLPELAAPGNRLGAIAPMPEGVPGALRRPGRSSAVHPASAVRHCAVPARLSGAAAMSHSTD